MSVVAITTKQDAAPQRFIEVGRSGLRAYGGLLDEEFLRELRGLSGIKIYREMSKNDPVIGASLFAYTTLAKEVTFRVESAKPGDRLADEIAEFVRGALFDDMNLAWRDLLGEIFSFLVYGWSYFEVVFKQRQGQQAVSDPSVQDAPASSRFADNRIGWRKWAIRSQDTLVRWMIDVHGGINGIVQRAEGTYTEVEIPIQKSLLFRTTVERGGPEGVSILRPSYTPFYFKRRIQILRGIGIERDLAGLPVITPPEHVDVWNPNDANAVSNKSNAEKVVRNIRRDEHEGIVKPFGWTLELLSSGGSRQFNITEVVAQLNAEIAMSMMTDFLLVGHEKIGARSLATDKRAVFSHAAASFLDAITTVINRFAFPDLVRINGWPTELSPLLKHGPVAEIELTELASFIKETAGVGLLFPDEDLERYLRERALLPPPPAKNERPAPIELETPPDGDEM